MPTYRLIVPLALALASFATGGGPIARADAPSTHTDAVFYTTDSQALAQQLGATPAASADYWISVAPYTAGVNLGKPKFLPAGAVVHAQGPRFHALAEIRLAPWCSRLDTASDAYATGQLLHDWMLVEGFDPARDAWAINEAGVPSNDACAQSLFTDSNARRNFQELVHGLYDGASGDAPIAGAIFAANPAQLAAPVDVAAYGHALATWYTDTPFWQDMSRYVRFWAQETYPDSRAWGVAGTSLADRIASLDDYFMFGRRLAAATGAGAASARTFFAQAYTPLGNASWKQPAPAVALGPGFGETDTLTADGMKGFISGQVSAFRSAYGARFGFAVVPKNAGTDKNPLELHIGAAIKASDNDPAGACAIASCDVVVDSAEFADAWRAFAVPPTIVSNIVGTLSPTGWYTGDVTVGWSVDSLESPLTATSGCDSTTVTEDTAGTVFACTATNRGGTSSAQVTIKRDATPPSITCEPTPALLWPPDGKLVPVSVDVSVEDATSGSGGFVLAAAPATDAAGFDVGTPDVAGFLRARRAGSGGGRTYTLTYVTRDVAGNAASCDVHVVVPHDLGS